MSANQRETPRTDELIDSLPSDRMCGADVMDIIKHARTLERQLAEAVEIGSTLAQEVTDLLMSDYQTTRTPRPDLESPALQAWKVAKGESLSDG